MTLKNGVNLHVFSAGRPEVDRMLTFRDWLRANPSDRVCMHSANEPWLSSSGEYMQNYADAKTPIIEEILARATKGQNTASLHHRASLPAVNPIAAGRTRLPARG
ncbi:MAG: GrpB family protein [Rhodospirillales bacterium]